MVPTFLILALQWVSLQLAGIVDLANTVRLAMPHCVSLSLPGDGSAPVAILPAGAPDDVMVFACEGFESPESRCVLLAHRDGATVPVDLFEGRDGLTPGLGVRPSGGHPPPA